MKKIFQNKNTLIVLISFLLIAIIVFSLLKHEKKYDPASEKVIRKEVASQLGKEPNDLTDEDFAKIKRLDLSQKKVYNISLLRKFTGLMELSLNSIPFRDPVIPKWMVVLAKLHVIDLYQNAHENYMEKCLIDLSPLQNLPNLQILLVQAAPIKNLDPIVKLENLREVHISVAQLVELGILKAGVMPEKVIINNKEFVMEWGFMGGFNPYENSIKPLPKIKYYNYNDSSLRTNLQEAERRIKIKTENALK